MEDQQIQRKPCYFIAVFGEKYAKEHPIHGGCYPIKSSYGDAEEITNGDIVLVYCAKGYEDEAGHKYSRESPGIGKVTRVEKCGERVYVRYDYKPFDAPIERTVIMDCLANDEKRNFINPGNTNNWLRKIRPASFKCVVEGKEIKYA